MCSVTGTESCNWKTLKCLLFILCFVPLVKNVILLTIFPLTVASVSWSCAVSVWLSSSNGTRVREIREMASIHWWNCHITDCQSPIQIVSHKIWSIIFITKCFTAIIITCHLARKICPPPPPPPYEKKPQPKMTLNFKNNNWKWTWQKEQMV